jgi:hypothetical protein
MRVAYILVHSDDCGTREEVKGYINLINEIIFWRYDISNCFYIISDSSSEILANKFRSLSNNKGRFIISEITGNSYGWLTENSWYLINNKQLKKEE